MCKCAWLPALLWSGSWWGVYCRGLHLSLLSGGAPAMIRGVQYQPLYRFHQTSAISKKFQRPQIHRSGRLKVIPISPNMAKSKLKVALAVHKGKDLRREHLKKVQKKVSKTKKSKGKLEDLELEEDEDGGVALNGAGDDSKAVTADESEDDSDLEGPVVCTCLVYLLLYPLIKSARLIPHD